MLVVVASYRQNVHAYPSGGGDYEVATSTSGPTRASTVASALLVDYVLTVAVSISSGVRTPVGVCPSSTGTRRWSPPVAVVILMALNLRGVRESGTFFAIPTYCFMFGDLEHGRSTACSGSCPRRADRRRTARSTASSRIRSTRRSPGFAMVVLLARAFSSGCAALTGVEAISNGVPAFQKPKSKNAATTLLLLGTIAVTMLHRRHRAGQPHRLAVADRPGRQLHR